MSEAGAMPCLTAAEYLAWEREQPEKHEYHLGEIFAMTGGSHRHNFLAGTALVQLSAALRGKGCIAFNSDQRIAAEGGKRYVYADAVVACGGVRSEPGTTDVLANPSIIVEVLSPSTEAHDRGSKWDTYQDLASLTDYLLVSQSSVHVEHFQRVPDGWLYRKITAGTVSLSNGTTLSVDAIYEGAFEIPGA